MCLDKEIFLKHYFSMIATNFDTYEMKFGIFTLKPGLPWKERGYFL